VAESGNGSRPHRSPANGAGRDGDGARGSAPSTPGAGSETGRGQTLLVALGVVARPHGLRGELRVKPYNPDTALLREPGRIVHLRPPGAETAPPGSPPPEVLPRRIEAVREGPDVLLIVLDGVDDREAADGLRGWEACVPRSEFPSLGVDGEGRDPDRDEADYYLVDLLGLTVVEATEERTPVGRVTEVLDYPSVDCLLVEGTDPSGGAVEWEVPLLERYVSELDLADGIVTVDHLDELPSRRRRPRRGGRRR